MCGQPQVGNSHWPLLCIHLSKILGQYLEASRTVVHNTRYRIHSGNMFRELTFCSVVHIVHSTHNGIKGKILIRVLANVNRTRFKTRRHIHICKNTFTHIHTHRQIKQRLGDSTEFHRWDILYTSPVVEVSRLALESFTLPTLHGHA